MKILWTPWRLKYILGEKRQGCLFCEKIAENADVVNYVLYRSTKAFIMLNAYPYNNGHVMVAPYDHVKSLDQLDTETLTDIMLLIKRSIASLRKMMNPNGFNVGANIGAVAGAGIEDHVHVHVVPRWLGDTNFMHVIAGTRLIPEPLDETYRKLQAAGIAEPSTG